MPVLNIPNKDDSSSKFRNLRIYFYAIRTVQLLNHEGYCGQGKCYTSESNKYMQNIGKKTSWKYEHLED
jgi:hypothetical protein